jgi:hypothetical protein
VFQVRVRLAQSLGNLGPGEYVGELGYESRAQQVLEASFDGSGNDSARDAVRGDCGGHEHARVQDDEHYEALRRSARAARSSS